MKTQTLFVLMVTVVSLQACGSSTAPAPIDCALYDFPNGGIFVTVVDSASGAPVVDAVTAIAIDRQYFNAVTTPASTTSEPKPIYLVRDRAGEYDVYVTRAAYKPWVTYTVVVKPGVCGGTQRIEMTAKLQSEVVLDSFRSTP
jgi:hypothetical protein